MEILKAGTKSGLLKQPLDKLQCGRLSCNLKKAALFLHSPLKPDSIPNSQHDTYRVKVYTQPSPGIGVLTELNAQFGLVELNLHKARHTQKPLISYETLWDSTAPPRRPWPWKDYLPVWPGNRNGLSLVVRLTESAKGCVLGWPGQWLGVWWNEGDGVWWCRQCYSVNQLGYSPRRSDKGKNTRYAKILSALPLSVYLRRSLSLSISLFLSLSLLLNSPAVTMISRKKISLSFVNLKKKKKIGIKSVSKRLF